MQETRADMKNIIVFLNIMVVVLASTATAEQGF